MLWLTGALATQAAIMRCTRTCDVIASDLVGPCVFVFIGSVVVSTTCCQETGVQRRSGRTACATSHDRRASDVDSRVQLARAHAHSQGPLHNASDGPQRHAATEDATEKHPFHNQKERPRMRLAVIHASCHIFRTACKRYHFILHCNIIRARYTTLEASKSKYKIQNA